MTIHIAGRLYTNTGQLCVRSMAPPSSAVFMGGTALSSSPSYITSNLAAAYLLNTGITVTGAGVSSWADQSGNGRDLLQGTDTNRPAKQTDGTILFDGVDNYLQAVFTLNQPATWYAHIKNVTWSAGANMWSGGVGANTVSQNLVTPNIRMNGGSAAAENTNLAVDTYGAVCARFNGASSLLQVNTTTPTTGDAGTQNAGGITLGANAGPAAYSNIQIKELFVYSVAHDSTQIAANISYINNGAAGTVYIEDLASSAVPAGSMSINGIAHNQNGRMYVTSDSPSSPMYINGLAVRQDGALHVSTSTDAGDVYINGATVSQDGILRIFYV